MSNQYQYADERIPLSFRNGTRPPIYTVAELKKELALLPDDLPLCTGFSESVKVVVPHIHGDGLQCLIEENEEGFD